MKKTAPNCGAPNGLPQGRIPSSKISLLHSKACIPTKVAPSIAVSTSNRKQTTRFFSYPNLTAIAIVPLLLISTKVMIAISKRGTSVPNTVKPKTSLAFGHSIVVLIRAVIYEIKKMEKMKVSDNRKIHIIALPQGAPLKATWSEDQSPAIPFNPGVTPGTTSAFSATIFSP